MATTVIDVLRRFLPSFQASAPPLCPAQWRAIWAITHLERAGVDVSGVEDLSRSCWGGPS